MIYPGAYDPRPRRAYISYVFIPFVLAVSHSRQKYEQFAHIDLITDLFRPSDLRPPLDYEEVVLTAKDGVRVRAYVICQPEPEELVNSENKNKQREVDSHADHGEAPGIRDEIEGYVSDRIAEQEDMEGSMEDLGLDVRHSLNLITLSLKGCWITGFSYLLFLSSTHAVGLVGHRDAHRDAHQMPLLCRRQFSQVRTHRSQAHPSPSRPNGRRILLWNVHLHRLLRKHPRQQRLRPHNSLRILINRPRSSLRRLPRRCLCVP